MTATRNEFAHSDPSEFAQYLLMTGREAKKVFWDPVFQLVYNKSVEVMATERERERYPILMATKEDF